MKPTHGNYDIDTVEGISKLRDEIKRMYDSDNSVEILAELLMNGHDGSSGYLSFGNNKVAKNTGIFNMNSATDCPNADTTENNQSDTGVCQVPWESCYAHKSENIFKTSLPKRRRQEYLWDSVSPEIFADALLRVKERKTSDFLHLRVSESGDFRHNGDIMAWEKVAELVSGEINVYTYSASHKLSAWDNVEHFTVNQSNALAEYGDREFNAVPKVSDIPDDAIACPFEVAKANGIETDSRPKCGDCTACIEPQTKQPRDVYVLLH